MNAKLILGKKLISRCIEQMLRGKTVHKRKHNYSINADEVKSAAKTRYASNPEAKKEADRARYASNPEAQKDAVKLGMPLTLRHRKRL